MKDTTTKVTKESTKVAKGYTKVTKGYPTTKYSGWLRPKSVLVTFVYSFVTFVFSL